jgi:cellulose synthase/poly-beta-1,6-N-acetylglucosamine synthase-like glycosyltransferase
MSATEISILICAHNEGRIIEPFLNKLKLSLTPRTEVLIGLDGCTDNTVEIASASGVGKIIEFAQRRGKSATLIDLVTKASGDIIIVCDVDWDVLTDPGWDTTLLKRFSNSSVGGVIVPTANMPRIDKGYLSTMSHAFLGEAWGTRFLWEYQLTTQTRKNDMGVFVDRSKMWFPFSVNICRKELISDFSTAGDDFERCLQVLLAGKELLIDTSETFLLRSTDVKKTFNDMFRQRIRGSTVYEKLVARYGGVLCPGTFMVKELFYAFSQSPRAGVRGASALLAWYALALIGSMVSKFRHAGATTDEIWKLRARR